MKTIEEAAVELADKAFGSIEDITFDMDKEFHNYHQEAFKSGVEFSQRWIPVEEELSDQGEIVLFKITIDNKDAESHVSTGYMMNGIPILDFDEVNIERIDVTHWRPIEQK